MEDSASAMLDDEETIQDSERQDRHREEVHGRNDLALIAKESSPKPAGVQGRRQTPEIAGPVRSETSNPSFRSSP
jgi:hypothetical protein